MEFNATFLVTAFSFIVFTLIMNFIFYKPIGNIIKKRQDFIDNTIDDAKNSNAEAEKILHERDSRFEEALQISKKYIFDKTSQANEIAISSLKKAKDDAIIKINETKSELEVQKDVLDSNLKPEIDKLSDVIYSKIFEV